MIEILKQALEALNLCTNAGMIPMYLQTNQTAITSLRQAIAELESQEPVAWRWETHNGYAYSEQHYEGEDGQPLFTHPPQRKPLTDEQVEKIIKANMSFQMNLAGIRQDFEAAYGIKE